MSETDDIEGEFVGAADRLSGRVRQHGQLPKIISIAIS
jgi:hypothetical protein